MSLCVCLWYLLSLSLSLSLSLFVFVSKMVSWAPVLLGDHLSWEAWGKNARNVSWCGHCLGLNMFGIGYGGFTLDVSHVLFFPMLCLVWCLKPFFKRIVVCALCVWHFYSLIYYIAFAHPCSVDPMCNWLHPSLKVKLQHRNYVYFCWITSNTCIWGVLLKVLGFGLMCANTLYVRNEPIIVITWWSW